ncbi:MAG: CBS domain-containing protein [Desulfobulbaceae bacterium]|jgi:tRNA nucleotidyltransferase (CCA-adding enzyme)|nr:CBS domain-containing protein [Desulfobulbaceae bacterium]
MDVITSHLNADFDCVASMVAAHKLYPKAKLVFPGSQEKNVRRFLNETGITFEFTRIKSITISEITRLIIVDTRQTGRIGIFNKCLDNPNLSIHLYDHHPDHPDNLKGDLEEVHDVGSTATIFVQLFQERNITISKEEATVMAMAIYEDTGNFTFATTTPADLAAGSWLMQQGANLDMVAQYMSHELTSQQVEFLHELLNSAATYTINSVPVTITRIILPEYCDEFALIVRRLMDMENMDALFAVAGMGHRVYVIGRSRIPEVNVGQIATELGGGGHASAASATLTEQSTVQVEEQLLALLHKSVRPRSLAKNLMSFPVITVKPELSIRETHTTLIRYNITVLPVMEDGHILGLISRREVAKAIFLELGDEPVANYMTTEFGTLPPTATILDIQKLILTHRQRTIPVVEKKQLIGIITRTDLFHMMAGDPALMPGLRNSQNQPSVERTRNVTPQLLGTLAKTTISLLKTIGEVGEACGYTTFVVGGFVRDLLLGEPSLDIDIVVEGDAIHFARKLADHFHGTVRTHDKFNTGIVTLPDGMKIDVATARLEYYDYPAALPKVECSSIKLDLFRRDFTINAMAIHLNPSDFGLLVDFFNSQNDLKDQAIRILHNLSFVEDPTRIFRAIRFEQRFGFELGKHTEKQVKNAVSKNLFNAAMGQRFHHEISHILMEKDPLPAIKRLAHFKLLTFLHPKLKHTKRVQEVLNEAKEAIAWFQRLYTRQQCTLWMVYMLALTSRLKTRELKELCTRLGVPERSAMTLIEQRVAGDRAITTLDKSQELKPSHIYFTLNELRPEGILYVMAGCRNKTSRQAVSLYVTTLSTVTTKLTGDDLRKLGYTPGPLFKTMLQTLLIHTLDGACSAKEDEVRLLGEQFPLEG